MDGDKCIDSDYCSDEADYIDFAKRNADKITEDTDVAIVVSMDDVDSTAVLDYGTGIVSAIKSELFGNKRE